MASLTGLGCESRFIGSQSGRKEDDAAENCPCELRERVRSIKLDKERHDELEKHGELRYMNLAT